MLKKNYLQMIDRLTKIFRYVFSKDNFGDYNNWNRNLF